MGEVTNNIVELLDGGRLLPLVEDFYTIQGEGYHTGKAAYFIRLGGCDVGCRWCDAKYTWNPRLYPPVEVATIVARATACAAQAVVVSRTATVRMAAASFFRFRFFMVISSIFGILPWYFRVADGGAAANG